MTQEELSGSIGRLLEFKDSIIDSIADVKNTVHNVSEKVDEVKDMAVKIEIQTTKTNGRVTSLESFRKASWTVIIAFLTGVVTVGAGCLTWFLIHHYK